jgi:hypothetical protein
VPITVALLGATLGVPATKLIFEPHPRDANGEFFVAASTALLSALVAFSGLKGPPSWAAGRVILYSFPAAAINAGLACQFVGGTPFPAPLPFVFASVVGFVVAAPLALAFSGLYAAIVTAAVRGASARSRQSEDRLVGFFGVVVFLAGLARCIWVADRASLVPVVLGAGVAAFAFGRAARRSRWLGAIEHGRVVGFAVVPADELGDDRLPCLAGDARFAQQVLIHQPTVETAYRTRIESARRLARVSGLGSASSWWKLQP